MNLSDMLTYADIQHLSKIAQNYRCECSAHSKNELIQSILMALNRREVFRETIRNLAIEDIRFLNSFLFDNRDSYSLEELIARVKQAFFSQKPDETVNPREMIARFKQMGWLFNGVSQQTKFLFQFPQDLKAKASDVLTEYFRSSLKETTRPEVYREESFVLADDILRFLQFIYHQEVPLTADGIIYKRTLLQILEKLAVPEEPVGRVGWRFGYGRKFREYPNRFSLIYDYCSFHGLINDQGSSLVLTSEGEKSVIGGKKEDIRSLFRFWMKLYKGPIYNLPSLVHWIDRLCTQWVTVQSLSEVLCKLIKPYYYDDPETILKQRILQMMMHLGAVRIGQDSKWGEVVQMTRLGSTLIQGTYVPDEETIKIDG